MNINEQNISVLKLQGIYVENFVEKFLKPYTNIISMAYIMNTDKYGNIPEV